MRAFLTEARAEAACPWDMATRSASFSRDGRFASVSAANEVQALLEISRRLDPRSSPSTDGRPGVCGPFRFVVNPPPIRTLGLKGSGRRAAVGGDFRQCRKSMLAEVWNDGFGGRQHQGATLRSRRQNLLGMVCGLIGIQNATGSTAGPRRSSPDRSTCEVRA